MDINDNTRIIDLTIGELKAVFAELIKGQDAEPSREVVRGIAGIVSLFGVSPATAQRYKNGILAPAVQQAAKGHSFVVDVQMARDLFNQHKNQ